MENQNQKSSATKLIPNCRFVRTVKYPNITRPEIIGYFSSDHNAQFQSNWTNLKYLKRPNQCDGNSLNFDLNKGYENVKSKPSTPTKENIDGLLEFIKRNFLQNQDYSEHFQSNCPLQADFVCFRGLLTLLLCTPYEFQNDWIILATKFKNTIYFCAQETEQMSFERANRTEDMKKYCSYGFKFEQYLLTDDPSKEPNTDVPVDECEEFCCMFKTTLESHKLLYGAEMDGIDSEYNLSKYFDNKDDEVITEMKLPPEILKELKFIELKTTTYKANEYQLKTFHKFVLRKWWCQSYLVNIHEIIIGYRTAKGIVDKIESIRVKDIPDIAEYYWKPSVCMDFCNQFLNMVKADMKYINCPDTVFVYSWRPQTGRAINLTKCIGINRNSFLPKWYTDCFSGCSK